MYLKQQKRSNGDIYLSIMEKYYVPKIGAREKTIEKLLLYSNRHEHIPV